MRARYEVSQIAAYDRNRYLRYSSARSPFISRANLAARITASYHGIEKGLSLPDPRDGFGATALRRLFEQLRVYRERFGDDELTFTAIGVISAYLQYHRDRGVPESTLPYYKELNAIVGDCPDLRTNAGVRTVHRSDVEKAVSGVTLDFFTTRSSVRQFADRPVTREQLEFAARAALKSPAVCNRQFGRIRVLVDRAQIDQALAIQGGANGFADNVPALAILTTRLTSYFGAGERTQAWTDGGMFAMSFVLGLHATGLGTVCLNWSKGADKDRELATAFGIDENEVIIMLVGFGALRDRYNVASSLRRDLSDVLVLPETVAREDAVWPSMSLIA